MDTDDISTPQRLDMQYNYMEENYMVAVSGSKGLTIDENGNTIGEISQMAFSYKKIKK